MTRHGSDQHGDGPGAGSGPNGPNGPNSVDGTRPGGGPARMVDIVAGAHLLTVNPVDGSEIQPCPPGAHPGVPRKLSQDQRVDALRPPAPAHAVPLLEREGEREGLRRLLARGRSVRVTGATGSGRTVLLDAVAEDVADLAPDGVIRLSGRHRTCEDLQHELFAVTHDAPLQRPDRDELRTALHGIGAVVVLDDLALGGGTLDELLDAAPECAFLFAAAPEAPAPSATSGVEDFPVGGLSRPGAMELLEHAVRRPLTDEEADRATDLWLASEGLPLSFVRAGALLRQQGGDASLVGPIAARVAEGLTETARETLRLAVALEGALPHHSHLPAVADDPQADQAVAELAGAGLVTRTGAHYRLAAGVADELAAAGHAEGAGARTRAVAQHYAWWAAHPSVTPRRVGAEADVLLAALHGAIRHGHASTAVLLARTAAPALAAALRWSTWAGALRGGREAARLSGEVAEQAYFHHESGVLAACTGEWEQALAELETSTRLRSALSDRQGTVAGRRALALVTDRLAEVRGVPAAEGAPEPQPEAGDDTDLGVFGSARGGATAIATLAGLAPDAGRNVRSRRARSKGRRNLAAGGAGALLAVLLGGAVVLGQLPGTGPGDRVRPQESVEETHEGELTAEEPEAAGGPAGSAPPEERETLTPGPTGEPQSPSAEPTASRASGSAASPESPGGGSGPGSSEPGDGESSGEGPSSSPGEGGGTGGSASGGSTDGGSDGGGTSDGGTSDGGTSDGGTSDGGASDGGSGSASPPASSPGSTPSSSQSVQSSSVAEETAPSEGTASVEETEGPSQAA